MREDKSEKRIEAEKRIEDYAIIGDGETAALVHRCGSIDWLCLPRFDSEACFTALLGNEDHGCWQMQPDGEIVSHKRRYLEDTLILETEFETADGRVAVIDFMPMRGEAPDIVRIVEGREGKVAMTSRLALRFDYGQIHPLVRDHGGDGTTLAISGPDGVRLDFDEEVEFEDRWFVSRFDVEKGDRRHFILTWFAAHEDVPEPVEAEGAYEETCRYWKDWVAGADPGQHHADMVERSLLTVKALIHRPTGGIIAALTSSLPENPGGARNWDYRFCWLRDATFTLLALLDAGLRKDARAWLAWLRRAIGGDPIDLRPFYTVDGDRRIIEWEADWLPGFNGAKPVRFGNGAVDQLQLDVYGEVIETLYEAERSGVDSDYDGDGDGDSDMLMRLVAARLEKVWQEPDAGIWESRGGLRHHVYSKAMCWVGFDRAAKWFADNDPDLSQHYAGLAQRVHDEVMERGVDKKSGRFMASYDENRLDASLLRLALVGFVDARHPAMIATTAAIEESLMEGELVWRYDPALLDDGIGTGEGAFLACSFWMAEVWNRQGRREEALALFDRLCRRANDVGLLSEEADKDRLLGNFPQALSHLTLIVTAVALNKEYD